MIYVYEHPETGKQIEVIQGMNDPHTYTDEKGVSWNRVFCAPTAVIKSSVNEWDQSSFLKKTRDMKGTVGDMMDMSAELSERRKASTGGTDPLQQKHFDEYAKRRRGKRHPKDPKVFDDSKLKGNPIKIEL